MFTTDIVSFEQLGPECKALFGAIVYLFLVSSAAVVSAFLLYVDLAFVSPTVSSAPIVSEQTDSAVSL